MAEVNAVDHARYSELINSAIPNGRKALLDSHKNLGDLAVYCEQTYASAQTPDAKNQALHLSKQYAIQSLASVAYMVNSMATNVLEMFNHQYLQLNDLESTIHNIKQNTDIHKEKVARREIGLMTSAKRNKRVHRMSAPEEPDMGRPYHRSTCEMTALDNVGHGVPKAEPRRSRRNTSVGGGSPMRSSGMHQAFGVGENPMFVASPMAPLGMSPAAVAAPMVPSLSTSSSLGAVTSPLIPSMPGSPSVMVDAPIDLIVPPSVAPPTIEPEPPKPPTSPPPPVPSTMPPGPTPPVSMPPPVMPPAPAPPSSMPPPPGPPGMPPACAPPTDRPPAPTPAPPMGMPSASGPPMGVPPPPGPPGQMPPPPGPPSMPPAPPMDAPPPMAMPPAPGPPMDMPPAPTPPMSMPPAPAAPASFNPPSMPPPMDLPPAPGAPPPMAFPPMDSPGDAAFPPPMAPPPSAAPPPPWDPMSAPSSPPPVPAPMGDEYPGLPPPPPPGAEDESAYAAVASMENIYDITGTPEEDFYATV